ncbi:MAG: hypothetical protein DME97_07285 [Verrucomicrobia bacterium]|nr:MAG: hypothetical protein DME97_07285 [Verrucomicrobiota bacterium]
MILEIITPTPNPPESALRYWKWLKDADIPNFAIFLFTAIVWPLALWVWSKRKVTTIPNLEVRLSRRRGKIDETSCEGIEITFVNKTGSVVYLSNGRLLGITSDFAVHQLAARDISDSSYELKFFDSANKTFHIRQTILQTDQSVDTWIALVSEASDALLSYKPSAWRKFLNRQRYFRLEFLAVVGEDRFRVSLPY